MGISDFSYSNAEFCPYKGEIIKHIGKERFDGKDEKNRYIRTTFCELNCIYCDECKNYPYRFREIRNVIINEFAPDDIELIYLNDFQVTTESFTTGTSGGASMMRMPDGVLFPKNEDFSDLHFDANLDDSAIKSLDNYYGYALANKWTHFITLTCDKTKVDRYNDDDVKIKWDLCRRTLRLFDKDIKILVGPERHKDGALHFHGFLATDKPFLCRLAKDPKTGEYLYSKCGAPLFEFDFWKYGMATFAFLDPNDNQRQVVNYLVKYVRKNDNLGYFKKRFYRSSNLEFKRKQTAYFSPKTLSEYCKAHDLELYRSEDGASYYRTRKEDRQLNFLYQLDNARKSAKIVCDEKVSSKVSSKKGGSPI